MNSELSPRSADRLPPSPHVDERPGTDSLSVDALRMHALCKGKVQMMPKCGIRGPGDFATRYTPGVAAPRPAIGKDCALAYEYTNRGSLA
jgi:malic enzyme